MNNSKIFNVGLRSLSIVLKFGLTFLIIEHSNDKLLGTFSLLGSSIIVLYTIIGIDFYSYSTREFINQNRINQQKILFNHFYLIIASYAIVTPLLYLFSTQYLNFNPFLFILLLFLEHLNQEFFRLFININKQLFANWVFFLRNGAWVILFFLHVQLFIPKIDGFILIIVNYWIFGEFLALVLSFIFIKSHFKKISIVNLDVKWLLKGIKICFWFFLSTIFQNLTIYGNRFVIDIIEGKANLGIFSFFFQLANMLNVFVFTVVVIYYYPKLLEFYKKNQIQEYLKLRAKFFKQVVIYSSITFILLFVAVFPVTSLLDKRYYLESVDAYIYLLLTNIAFNISLVWHYNIYNQKKDIMLFLISLIGFAVNFLLTLLLVSIIGITGASLGSLISAIIILFLKAYFSSKLDAKYGFY